jgi:microcystin-dependent protein
MVGDTKTSMVRVDHLGWLVCDGRSLLKSEYRSLYAVLGDSFGSVDADHFNLPDAQGRVVGLIGQAITDSSSNLWVDGDLSGEETHTLVIAEMPSHRHGSADVSGSTDGDGLTGISGEHTHVFRTTNDDFNNTGGKYGIPSDGGTYTTANFPSFPPSDSAGTVNWTSPIQPTGNHRHTIGLTGGSQPHNNLQPTIFMGNLFVYCGRVVYNVTDADGISPPLSNPSYYPPSTPANRLY